MLLKEKEIANKSYNNYWFFNTRYKNGLVGWGEEFRSGVIKRLSVQSHSQHNTN
jgi:hypothetical protein